MNNNLRQDILDKLEVYISPKRFQHTLGVEEIALRMAELYEVNKEKVYIAALLHDLAKELPSEELIKLSHERGWEIGELEKEHPGELLHGPASSALAQGLFKLDDDEILNAISYHTLGRPGMTKLEKIIYIADMVEPNRDFPGVDKLRELAFRNLDLSLQACLEHTINFLRSKNSQVHPQSLKTLMSIKKSK